MLSRVAERVYWMSRYLERVENASRLVGVYSELLMDLPDEAGLDWLVALRILGMKDAFPESANDKEALAYLLVNPDNVACLLNSMNFARENARTTRDIVPSEAWRAINELHLYADQNLKLLARRPNAEVPDEVVGRCHQITGILEGTMSHGPAYHFVRLGRSLERADMTSRIMDVAAATMLTGREELERHNSTVWTAVLRAQSAYQMYRQYVRRRILGADVVAFLLNDTDFPRSITHCVGVLEQSLAALPNHEKPLSRISELRSDLASLDPILANHEDVQRFADDFQLKLAGLHGVIFETWLDPLRSQ